MSSRMAEVCGVEPPRRFTTCTRFRGEVCLALRHNTSIMAERSSDDLARRFTTCTGFQDPVHLANDAISRKLEPWAGFEPTNKGFADLCLNRTWLPRLKTLAEATRVERARPGLTGTTCFPNREACQCLTLPKLAEDVRLELTRPFRVQQLSRLPGDQLPISSKLFQKNIGLQSSQT